ncbi:MAG TPA: antitoxin Xre/MbcA/ParS toxin-binding domain-containing protein [Pseudomonas sp.]|uniref:antitoxin Xre/MbcA/ParS toxin-binding domain-containing protein n=1 Tax=Pseudomonas sp. TaxID=306 RepID=UPI002ED8CEE6
MDKTGKSENRKCGAESALTFWLIADQLNARTEGERLSYIRSGFPPGWVKVTREAFRLDTERLEQLLNASISTLERRQRQQQPLDLVSSERLDRIASIATQAVEVFENPDIARCWMVTRNAALGDQRPIDLCETEIGARQIRRVLSALVCGGAV